MSIKIREVSVEVLGIWQMLQYCLSTKSTSSSLTLQKAMTSGLVTTIYDIISQVCNVKIPTVILQSARHIDKYIKQLLLYDFSYNAIAHFIVYYMQPSIIFINDKICFNNADLISNINLLSGEMLYDMINNENTLCFMIGNIMRQHHKFSLKHIKTSILDSINDTFIRSMMIFNFVHKLNCNHKPLKVIAEYFYEKLASQYLTKIKNLVLRSKIQNLLQDATKNGDISLMFEILQSKEIDDKNAIYFKKLQKVEKWQSKIQKYNVFAR
jgi:hypothetical protein